MLDLDSACPGHLEIVWAACIVCFDGEEVVLVTLGNTLGKRFGKSEWGKSSLENAPILLVVMIILWCKDVVMAEQARCYRE